MAIKTILVHVNEEKRAGALLDVAIDVASRNEAHLIGLFVVPPASIGSAGAFHPGISIDPGLAGRSRQYFREEAERIRNTFEQAAKGRPIVAEWRMLDPDVSYADCASAVMEHARTVDLVIASQTDQRWDYHVVLDFPERLALESGRPALIVPHWGRFPHVGKSVVVAWNGTREAARATFDALPLLRDADIVRVLWVDQSGEAAAADTVPAAEIAATLARHGVQCEAAHTTMGGIDIGNVLLSRLADYGADMLVMGCYGHSRFREFVMGGASRNILRQMTVPVLMSH